MTLCTAIRRAGTPVLILAICCLTAGLAVAQPRTAPLTIEGTQQRSAPSAAIVGAGGVSMILGNHAPSMHRDPATLTRLSGIQIGVSGSTQSFDRSQVQHYAPVRYYPNLSLLLEGLTDQIPDPPPGTIVFTPADSVWRPHDDIRPNWSTSGRSTVPIQGFIAAPLDLGAVRLAAGFSVAEYGDFGYFYQNNNVLSPDILDQRPQPISRPTDDNPLEVDWHQVVRQREGAVMGYGGALALEWKRYGITFGATGTVVNGSTDDFEQNVARGRLVFFANSFQLDSLDTDMMRSGRSEFSGFDGAFSTTVRGERVAAGITVRLPMTLTRQFEMSGATGAAVSGEDELRLPLRGHGGIALSPRDDLTFGMEYEVRPYANAEYRSGDDEAVSPWLSSSAFRFGLQYDALPWLSIRGGLRREAEPFGASGRAIENDPVWHTAYSLGAGLSWMGVQFNLAAETRAASFEDVMGTAIHYNEERRLMLVADLAYTFNWGR